MPVIDNLLMKDRLGESACRCSAHNQIAGFGGPAPEPQYPPSVTIEPTHLELDLVLNLKAETLKGKVTHTVVGRGADARTLVLDAVAFQDIAVRDTGDKKLQHQYDGNKLTLTYAEPLTVGEQRKIEIAYTVEKPVSGLFFMQPSKEYPNKAYYAATDHETERARYWLPCVDLPTVRTTLEFKITAEEHLTILANGFLVGEKKNSDGTKTAQWRLDQRCPSYLVCFAVGDFVRFDDGDFEGLPVAAFTSKDFSKDDLKRSFGRTKEMLGWMSKKLAVRFPFPKYFQFALPAFGGAMENISLVSWSDQFVLTERMAPEGTWLTDQVNVHEMAHSYFGDLVVIRDFAHAWLKESWATYMEACWLEDKRGEDEQLYDLWRNAQAYFMESDESYARPLVTRQFTSSWQMYDRHLYPGGACRLHTMRKELGDQVFWNGVSDYLQANREQTVETEDFRKALEKASGRSLVKLFDQWVYTAAYPQLKVGFSYDKEKGTGTFEVEQKQADEKKGIPAFDLSTDVAWVIDGQLTTQAVKLGKARQSFTFRMEKDPDQVRFDPNGKVLHKLEFTPGDDKLRAQLKGAKDVVGRIQAAMALAETGKRANIRAIVEQWKKEPFWGVRREIVKAFEKAQTTDAMQALIEIIAGEKDPLVLDRVFDAAAAYRDPLVADAVRGRLEKGGLGPMATSGAYFALGAQRDNAPVDFLRKMTETEDRAYGYEQAAAMHALGMSRKAGEVPFLRGQAAFGKVPYKARRGAITGLGAALPFLELPAKKPAEETIVDTLRDPEPWMRHVAARTLKTARVKEAIPALESFRRTLPLQEQVMIDGYVSALQKGEEPKTAALEKQLDELSARFRKLVDKLQGLEDKMS